MPLPIPLYIQRKGAPQRHTRFVLAVCGAPSKVFHLDHIVVVLRRSPASVEHQDRPHAVVLTELLPEALMDRSPGIVIELNVC